MKPGTDALLVLRGLACLGVVLGHLSLYSGANVARALQPFYFPGVGYEAVWLFFMLSSFLLTKAFLEGRFTFDRRGVFRFYLSRALRLLPLFYVVWAVYAALAAARLLPVGTILDWRVESKVALLSIAPGLRSAFLTPSLYGFNAASGMGSVNAPVWSVIIEIHFILLLPLLARLLTRTRAAHIAFLAAWAFSNLWAGLTHRTMVPEAYTSHVYNFGFLALGQLLAWEKAGEGRGQDSARILAPALAVLAAVLANKYIQLYWDVDHSLCWSPFLLAPAYYWLIARVDTSYQMKLPDSYAGLIPRSIPGFFERAGAMSYSIYLCHKPLESILIDRFGLAGAAKGWLSLQLFSLGILASVIAVATLLYVEVETRFRLRARSA